MPTISCPSCQAGLKLPASTLGRRVLCPNCDKVFLAEAPAQREERAAERDEVRQPERERLELVQRGSRREDVDDDYDDDPRMVPCDDCTKLVSARAYECPSCGAPLRKP